jgi:two-component system phosphate regulon sensor histidine kinase PhoR
LLDGAWKDKAVAKKFMRKALNSADRLENLVQDLTSISELESGREKLTLKEFDIRLLILKTFESMEIKAKKRNVTLSLKRNPSGSSIVLADENMIHQVLVNLLENSIKYGKESGNTWINLVDIDGRIWIEVCDDGEGIEEEHHHRLFERFYRTDSARSRDLGGSGLGLAIAKHIIEAHGQKIDVSSTKGIGTTFSFSLETAS